MCLSIVLRPSTAMEYIFSFLFIAQFTVPNNRNMSFPHVLPRWRLISNATAPHCRHSFWLVVMYFCLSVSRLGHNVFLFLNFLSLNLWPKRFGNILPTCSTSFPFFLQSPPRPPTTIFGWLLLVRNKQRPHNGTPPPPTLCFEDNVWAWYHMFTPPL